MANLQTYTRITAYIATPTFNGLMAENVSVTIKHASNAKPVHTGPKGFSGMSPGSPLLEIQMKFAAPAAGFEYDPTLDIENLTILEWQLYAANRVLVPKGYITSSNLGWAVDTEAGLEMDAMCQFATWQPV